MSYVKDTIAARATPPGKGGIGIIRVSGSLAPVIAAKMLGRLPAERHATFSSFCDDQGGAIDHGIALYFKAPDSFTGEDVLELHGHGGPVVLDLLLQRIIALGARIAAPGEFSQRAFLNDKMDLAQAEAIADLIDSGTQQAARGAMRSLQGEFSNRVNTLQTSVTGLRVLVEAAIDFPEEETDFLPDGEAESHLEAIRGQLEAILVAAGNGVLLSEGASVVLIGKPNAGKSSLMNALTGRDTSIVTDIPGTTRDVIDEDLQLDGIPLRLLDTAGIRESDDRIEAEGVRRALVAGQAADLLITIRDASLDEDSWEQLPGESSAPEVRVMNKIDLLADRSGLPGDCVAISAKTGEGINDLKYRLKQVLGFQGDMESGFTARRRHLTALEEARDALYRGKFVLAEGRGGELLAEELRVCQQHLSALTGEYSADDLLGEIFSSFCIGK